MTLTNDWWRRWRVVVAALVASVAFTVWMGGDLVMTTREAASGGNGTALWSCMVASIALLWLAWHVHDRSVGFGQEVLSGWGATYTYALIGLGLGLYATRSGLWQPYYLARAAGFEVWALGYQQAVRGVASVLTAGTAFVGLMHIRYLLEPRFGRWWLGVVALFIADVFAVHAYLPRLIRAIADRLT